MDKRELRRLLRAKRNALTPRQRRVAAERLVHAALAAGLLLGHRRLGFYVPFDGEMDPLPLLNRALWLKKRCYLPVVPQGRAKRLAFTRVSARRSWYLNRFGIQEHFSPRPLRARQLDVVFVPLVGFDDAGHRLGFGGGFYDTSLAHLARRRAWRKPRVIGVAFECQRVSRLPHEAWDIPLDAVLTEVGLHRFRR